jgi:hypothetical protein
MGPGRFLASARPGLRAEQAVIDPAFEGEVVLAETATLCNTCHHIRSTILQKGLWFAQRSKCYHVV